VQPIAADDLEALQRARQVRRGGGGKLRREASELAQLRQRAAAGRERARLVALVGAEHGGGSSRGALNSHPSSRAASSTSTQRPRSCASASRSIVSSGQ